ncbi:MAG: HAD-IC family P-type ATPase [Asgard group archaeon]|nr:HAD-IC family P-type ATPase [Asgard group archaeon]
MDAHSLSIDEIYDKIDSNFRGISSEEAEKRLNFYGKNEIPSKGAVSPWKILLNQFKDLLVLILVAAGIITAIIGIIEQDKGSIVEIVAIFIVVALNALLGFYQEYSAEKAITALRSLAVSEVIAVRDNQKTMIKAEFLVPGDIVVIESGDTVAADLRIIEGYEVRTLESILTGESVPVRKDNEVLADSSALADRINMLYKGTTVVNGSGLAIVVATGLETELGKIASSLMEIKSEDTPIQKKLAKLAKQLTIGIIILSVLILVLGSILMRNESISDLFIFSIGLAVAAVPEGLPAVLTLTLAIGITRMAKKRSLIRKLPAVEVLGSATIICTDKTGTLTKNEMTVEKLWVSDEIYDISGTGYIRDGEIIDPHTGNQIELEREDNIAKAIEVCTLANEAAIELKEDGEYFEIFGDPTEASLLILAEKSKLREDIIENHEIKYLFPFDSNRKRMSVIIQNKETKNYRILAKGAIDILLDLCTHKEINNNIIELDDTEREKLLDLSSQYSSKFAYRILALTYKDLNNKEAEELILSKNSDLVERNLVFLGFVAMLDPPRDQSRPAIERARSAGIKVMMITGDHMETAKAIGKSITLCKDMVPFTGKELDEMSDEELEAKVDETEIFARVNPSHKLRIVEALKKNHEIVIMTGDGVNDAPALKRADVGVSMGISGTDVAKEASDMVLVDDNFANIIESVYEGRIIYDNMKKFIAYLLSANAGEILTVLFGLILSFIFIRDEILLPIVAIQLLYINLVTDTLPALALGVSAPETNVMKRPPRNPDEPLLDREMLFKVFLTGLLYGIGTMIIFFWITDWGADTSEETVVLARTMVFAALVIYQLLNSLSTSINRSIFSKKILRNRALFGAIFVGFILLILSIYTPFLQPFLQTVNISGVGWGIIFATASPIALIEEVRKFIVRKKYGFPDVEEYDYLAC